MAPVGRELYRVKWNNFTGVLRSNLRKYLQDESFADVTLACEGQRIKCHRVILSSASEYFDSLLNSNEFPDSSNTIIYLKDVKFWELKTLVEYLYNGEITISEEKLRRISAIAESLKIKGFAGEEGVIDEDIAQDLGLTNVKIRPVPHQQLQQQSNRLEQALKRKAPLASSPPKLIKIQKSDHAQFQGSRLNSSENSNGISSKVKLPRESSSSERPFGLLEQTSIEPKLEMEEIDGKNKQVDDDENELEIAEVETSLEENPASSESDSEEDETNGNEKDVMELLEMEIPQVEMGNPPQQQRKSVYKYSQEIRDSVLRALTTGMSLRQCSEKFRIPRKTISKWKQREAEDANNETLLESLPIMTHLEEEPAPGPAVSRKPTATTTTVQAPKRRGPGVSIDSGDRAERLEAACKLALSGTTVRQAAVTYEIPRTTLCAYMKRKGLQAKNKNLAVGNQSSAVGSTLNSSVDDFPFLGLSDLIDDVDGDNDYGEEEEDIY